MSDGGVDDNGDGNGGDDEDGREEEEEEEEIEIEGSGRVEARGAVKVSVMDTETPMTDVSFFSRMFRRTFPDAGMLSMASDTSLSCIFLSSFTVLFTTPSP